MGERALGWGLRLLGIALFIGPFIAAFAAHNWDLQAAVMPSQEEMDEVRETISGVFSGEFSGDILENQGPPTIDLVTSQVSVTVKFTSPFNLDVKITDISGGFSCEQHGDVLLAHVQMDEQEVNLPANGTATFTLVGTLTPEGNQHIVNVHGGSPPSVTPTNMSFELEFYGVTVRVENMFGG